MGCLLFPPASPALASSAPPTGSSVWFSPGSLPHFDLSAAQPKKPSTFPVLPPPFEISVMIRTEMNSFPEEDK
ncbi:hypothetical protein OPV22_035219, partial [Ensete ventricosum]